jgi:hypothetical protein
MKEILRVPQKRVKQIHSFLTREIPPVIDRVIDIVEKQ